MNTILVNLLNAFRVVAILSISAYFVYTHSVDICSVSDSSKCNSALIIDGLALHVIRVVH